MDPSLRFDAEKLVASDLNINLDLGTELCSIVDCQGSDRETEKITETEVRPLAAEEDSVTQCTEVPSTAVVPSLPAKTTPLPRTTFDESTTHSTASVSTHEMMTLHTENGPYRYLLTCRLRRKSLYEKCKRNVTDSYRFRQCRKERERETAEKIASLEQQVPKMEEEDKRQRVGATEPPYTYTASTLDESFEPSLVAEESRPKKRKAHSVKLQQSETAKRKNITPEGLITTETADEDTVVIDLLEKYTALFE